MNIEYELQLVLNDEYATHGRIYFESVLRALCEVTWFTDEGVKRLAYPINGHDKAHYMTYSLRISGKDADDIRAKARLVENLASIYADCLRFLLLSREQGDA